MWKVANFRDRITQWGLKRAVHWTVMATLGRIGIHVHYVNVLSGRREIDMDDDVTVPEGYETRPIGLDELLTHVDKAPDLVPDRLRVAFARGDLCIANLFRGELVGYAFSSWTRTRVNDQIDVLIPRGFRYGYKGWTHPDHRQLHLSRMRGHVRRRYRRAPHEERGISYVETHNYPSALHTYRHPNLRSLRMGFCGWITIFGRKIPFNTRRAKWIGFEMVRKDDDGKRQYV